MGLFKVYRSFLCPCRKMDLLQLSLVGNTQFLAALGTAAGQYFAPISCLHAFAETVYGFAAFAMRLKCTFHI